MDCQQAEKNRLIYRERLRSLLSSYSEQSHSVFLFLVRGILYLENALFQPKLFWSH